jgi:hypothetical protein
VQFGGERLRKADCHGLLRADVAVQYVRVDGYWRGGEPRLVGGGGVVGGVRGKAEDAEVAQADQRVDQERSGLLPGPASFSAGPVGTVVLGARLEQPRHSRGLALDGEEALDDGAQREDALLDVDVDKAALELSRSARAAAAPAGQRPPGWR